MRVKTLKKIRYNGKTFEKGEELEFLNEDEAKEYVESGIFIELESDDEISKMKKAELIEFLVEATGKDAKEFEKFKVDELKQQAREI